MRPPGSPRTLERRRHRTIELLEQGWQPVEVARQLGVDRRSVRRWEAAYLKGGETALKARPAPGRRSTTRPGRAWNVSCSKAPEPPAFLRPIFGPARGSPRSLPSVSVSSITSITSGDCCTAWAGVRRSRRVGPSNATRRRLSSGSRRTGPG